MNSRKMKYRLQILLSIILLAFGSAAGSAESRPPLLLETPTISRTQVAFSYAGDIWIVGRSGGDAQRLTTNPARETAPVFSPDGSQIVFARLNVNGGPFSWDVFLVPAKGGEERRLTFHPDLDFPIGWTPDGKNILILTFRERMSLLGTRLYTVPAAGGPETEVSVPRGWAASFSPAGDRIAYTPLSNVRSAFSWGNYRGGGTSRIWLVKLSDGGTEVIPHADFNDTDPMWVGDKVYFVSDRAGAENLFAYDTTNKSVLQLTHFEKYGIGNASTSGDAIVFNQDGALHLFDLRTAQITTLNIRVSGDFPEVTPHKVDPAQWLNSVGLSPDAGHMLLGIRGEVFTANLANGAVENLTQTGAAAERNPVWSPDGKWIAYFSDQSGGQQLFLRAVEGGAIRRVTIEPRPGIYSELQWSPDSKKLAFSDSHLGLWCFDLDLNAARRIDSAKHTDGDSFFQPAWSPDSHWLAYSKFGFHRVRIITLYSFDSNQSFAVTSPQIDSQSPVFDLNGRYLYFIGSNRTGLVESQGMSGFPFRTQVARSLYAVVLGQTDASPLVNSPEKPVGSRVVIDREKLGERVVPIPSWPPNAGRIMAGKAGTLFIVEGNILHKFVAGKPGLEKFVEGAGNYRINSDGSHLLFRRQGNWSVVSTDTPPKADEGRVKVNPIEITIDPRAEWKQMFEEAWRRMRENFYDPNLHGQNIEELKAHYAAYLPNVNTRDELNLLFGKMFSHLSTSHMGYVGGEVTVPQGGVNENVGLLGADYEIENGRYRIKHLLYSDNSRGISSPLRQPGTNVKMGEYLLAVDGVEIKADENLYRYFLNKAGKRVELKLGPKPDGLGSRVISVTAIGSEFQLRQYDWAERNRLRVEQLSGGKLAYMFLPDTADSGYNIFNREFYAQLDKQGIIVDGRFNEGGRAADYIIDILRRVPMERAKLRDAEDIRIPTGIIEGPKVLLTNESAGSGGDSLPWMWQRVKLGPVVGTRTAGAGIGASTYQLIDGGSFRVPDWGWYDPQTGNWLMENRGVAPDYQLEIMPPDWRAGRDPQLEKAVQLAMDALKKQRPTPPRQPAYPIYK
jgi:tricorn protease